MRRLCLWHRIRQGSSIFIVYCYVKSYLKIEFLKTTNSFCFTSSVHQESWCSLAVSRSLVKLQCRCRLGLPSHGKAWLKRHLLPSSLMGLFAGFLSFSFAVELRVCFLLVAGQRFPSVSCHMSLSREQLAFSRANERTREGIQGGSKCFSNLIHKIIFYNFCHIVFLFVF